MKMQALCPSKSAKVLFTTRQKFFFTFILLVSIGLSISYPALALVTIVVIANLCYLTTNLLKLMLFWMGARDKIAHKLPDSRRIERDLPSFTILIPLFKEQNIQDLVNAIASLDYPSSKLEVKLVIEEDDLSTSQAIDATQLPAHFAVVKVPYSLPRTKPKALNYALQFVKSDYVSVYDAEDVPDSDQLMKVVAKFHASSSDVMCVQAKLICYNRDYNLLTSLMALEYSFWFEFLLKGLELMGIPIPLGGTSNHLSVDKLNEIGGWDPYNVTEDADLGIRITASGYKSCMVDSHTQEEMPAHVSNWFWQRVRWIKGHMQTYIVHTRNWKELFRGGGGRAIVGAQIFIGLPVLVFLLVPIMFIIMFADYTGIFALPPGFESLKYLNLFNLVMAVIAPIILSLITCKLCSWPAKSLKCSCIVYPFYLIMHSIAAFSAVYQLVTNPHYWNKTTHGHVKYIRKN